ncbi:Lrp/AsnC family transcriptional regulator [Bacillus sp. FJAT-42315]|uniref:Lrp/AsnC family transcriptional regulator n=1 Tax=Bacillus sp. FJAT-42315 TaxID=2014077 RepID=UPI000C236106|nr:Lrp/AsnC family transcriptional regulator [Bacillus sp. FJAT-42315]
MNKLYLNKVACSIVNKSNRLDQLDYQILSILKENSRIPISAIAKKIHMSQPAVKERLIKMEESKVIDEYTLNLGETIQGMITFILLKTSMCMEVEKFCKDHKNVVDLHRISGDDNYLLKVSTKDTDELTNFQQQLVKYGPSKSLIRTKRIFEDNYSLMD